MIISLPFAAPPILACGAWLKNTVCVTQQREARLSALNGNLDQAEARTSLEQQVAQLLASANEKPCLIAHDLHPDFYSTQFAQAYASERDIPLLAVQHHHAHIAAICAEHGISHAVLGLALDGVGLGNDNMPWGGELLRVQGAHCERLGHLAPLAMPGGDRAAGEPWRMAAAALQRLGRTAEIPQRFASQPAAATVASMLKKQLNCPTTSSMGRLFDAAAALLGINLVQQHEAEAAIQLQQLAEHYLQQNDCQPLPDGYQITADGQLDFLPLLASLSESRHDAHGNDAHGNAAQGAALFHVTLSAGLADWVATAAANTGIAQIALGGGCFHNALLTRELQDRLQAQGLSVLPALNVAPDDSAIALGQAWVALQSLREGS